ncbi:putative ATP-dependent RNA helicase DDX5 [Armadillidium nasatum]|uniref:RNA helicase n=1 Tax=Armadillidium nasatum TaxID=96803 RepID=A0A5N5SMI1_9CRUS|nr:putative ATP-dependent RNA helicase DDX5 [Armadillidium nasatum]
MEKVNFKLLNSLLKISPASLSPPYSAWFLSTVISKISRGLFHNGSWKYTKEEDCGSSNNNFSGEEKSYNFDYEEDEFIERPENFNYGINNQGVQKEKEIFNTRRNIRKPNWQNIKLKALKKNVYINTPHIENRSEEEIENYRKLYNLTLQGNNIPNPILKLSDYEFPKEVVKSFKNMGIETLTPIQAQGWPVVLKGHDFIGIGQTGSGKTLGYIVPGLVHVLNQPPLEEEDGPIGLVLAPTRELVQQIHDVSVDMFTESHLKIICLYGGCGVNIKNKQIISLRKWPHFCIATPSRLLDFLEIGATNLNRCTFVVLDEADRMLNMGFEPQIRRIVKQIRPDRQMLMWSATWPKQVQKLAHNFLLNFIQLNVGSSELYANSHIKQEIEVCEPFAKQDRFVQKLRELKSEHEKILVFAQTKVQVDFVVNLLNKKSLFAVGMHSDYIQKSREYVLKRANIPILVATDIASRGIDVSDITIVINYDFPPCIEDYVHRIGRTGRAGKTGTSLSFITSDDNMNAIKDLIKLLEKGNCEVSQSLYNLSKREKELKEMKRKFKGFDVHQYSRFRNKFK